MRLVIDIGQMIQGQMGVPLRGRQTGMAQKFLYRPQVSPHLQEMGGKRMAQGMGRDHLGDSRPLPVQLAPSVQRCGWSDDLPCR